MQIVRAPGSENNGLATMLATLAEQNLNDQPKLASKVDGVKGRICIIAEDADVVVTIAFRPSTTLQEARVEFADGMVGLPDLTFRGGFESISELSRMEVLGSVSKRLWKGAWMAALRTKSTRLDKAAVVAEMLTHQLGETSALQSVREFVHELPDPRGEVNASLARALRSGELKVHGLPRATPLLLAMGSLLSAH